jgi:hypothetical protein
MPLQGAAENEGLSGGLDAASCEVEGRPTSGAILFLRNAPV